MNFLSRPSDPLPFTVDSAKKPSSTPHRWYLLLVVAFSWIASYTTVSDISLVDLELELERLSHYVAHVKEEIQELDTAISKARKQWKTHQRTHRSLEHELRILHEVQESTGKTLPPPPQQPGALLDTWFRYRRTTLEQRIGKLQSYLQATSRRALAQQYGPGPYRVRVTAAVANPMSGRRRLQSFVVETVDPELMPVSIQLFLDSVTGGLWNHTVFLHNEETDHVLLAAPLDYTTQRIKSQQLGSMGWVNLGFPEYTDRHPHVQYTVGFAGLGPTFYINTMDNRKEHGPDGQAHHVLPGDAEPCFGKVVEGIDVIDELVRIGMHQKEVVGDSADVPWTEKEHRKTRIVSIELLAKEQ